MGLVKSVFVAIALSTAAFGATTASASSQVNVSFSVRPAYCPTVHDHRSHDAHYYDFYPADDFFRAGPYRPVGNYDRRYDDRRYDDRYDNRYDDRRGGRGRIVNRQVFDTRYDARIVLVEEVFYSGYGQNLVCTVDVRGPDRHYVSRRQLQRIANRYCSYGARIHISY